MNPALGGWSSNVYQLLSTKVIFPGPEDWRDYKGINMYEKNSIIRAKACQNVAILCNPEWYSKGVLSNHGRITGLRILQVHTKSLYNVDSFSTFTDLQVPGKRDQKEKTVPIMPFALDSGKACPSSSLAHRRCGLQLFHDGFQSNSDHPRFDNQPGNGKSLVQLPEGKDA